jgi:DmsE family decaheme c-type cytochrome
MDRRVRKLSRTSWLICGSVLWLAACVGIRANSLTPPLTVAAAAQSVAPLVGHPKLTPAVALRQAATTTTTPQGIRPPDPSKPNNYVGDESCLGCHDDQRQGYERTLHYQKVDPRTPAAKQGCETCHGPGSQHVDDPDHVDVVNNFEKMAPAEVSDTCTTCHNRGEHALWEGSPHERRDLGCASCHSIHEPRSDTGSLKAANETDVCASCHREKAAKLDRSGHMPLREGKMSCSTCHNMHGSTNVSLLRKGDSIAEMCTSCHADKRGPFVFEHAPSRDGCVTCHDPHGSSNERMLVVKTPMLCQRCHVATRHPSTIYDQALINTSVRVYARSCVTCHTNMHGSNHPSGRFFIR